MNKFMLGFFTWFPIAYILPIGLTKFGPSWLNPPPGYLVGAIAFGLWMGFCYSYLSVRGKHLKSEFEESEK